MDKHVLRILTAQGDIKKEWFDPAGPEAKEAAAAFGERADTHMAVADGKPVRAFNPEARETTQFPRMQAGR